MDTLTTPPLAPDDEAYERSLVDDVRQLAEDARALAQAEAAYQKARAAFVGQEAKWIALAGLLAAALVFFALMALTMGLLLALSPLITPWGATAVVVGGLLAAAALCVMSAARRWGRMSAAVADNGDQA